MLVVAARYDTSPVGPYLELAVVEPVRRGALAGTCATTMVVDSAESRHAGRTRWGFPKELGTLRWSEEDGYVTLRWEERAVVVTGRPAGPTFPALVPYWSLQARADGPVRVGGHLRGSGRLSRVNVTTAPGDSLGCLAGRHRGMSVTHGTVTMGVARPLARRR